MTPELDSESAEWVRSLHAPGAVGDAAVKRLHELLLRVARAEAYRRGGAARIAGPELDDVAQQAAADALLAITRKLDQFRGDSRFTTWAYKFVVLEVASKLGRHAWRRAPVQLESEDWERLPERFGFGPEEAVEARDLLDALHRAVDEELTAHQRDLFVAIVLDGRPLDEVVAERDTNRNAVYKALFDARRKLRASLVANGYLDQDTT